MHAMDGWGFFGMHFFWWLFWLLIIIAFAWMFMPALRQQVKHRGAALDLLQRRYAAGEISTEEYDQRRSVLVRDAGGKD